MRPTINLKVATANLNQTIQNFTRNVPNIKRAIDRAVADGADVLCLQELGLTGYSGDDQFKWIRTDKQGPEILALVQEIADYAASKDPNLVVSLGFPLFHADKSEPPMLEVAPGIRLPNALYNINDRPFNAQAFLTGGRIQAISAKSIQPDGAAEYEPRQFASWPEYMGTRTITLPNGQQVPLGKPVLQLEKNGKKVNLYHEICAEAWPGVHDDGTVNEHEQKQTRYIVHLAQGTDLSLVINPSASKPEPALEKPGLRELLCTTGSTLTGGAGYVYTNALGNESGYSAMEGDGILAGRDGIIRRASRYRMESVNYSSATLAVPLAERGTPHAVAQHEFRNRDRQPDPVEAKPALPASPGLDPQKLREYREVVSNTVLWMRDYLEKTSHQGFVISLSGGADSAFGALMVTTMIDENIRQFTETLGDRRQAVAAFINQFPNLKYRPEVLRVNADEGPEAGPEAAIKLIKQRMLTCVTMPSKNSSATTRSAAEILIEGGKLPDTRLPDGTVIEGAVVEGIGGTLKKVDIQDTVDSYIEAMAGIVKRDLPEALQRRVRAEITEYVEGERREFSDAVKAELKYHVPRWPLEKDKALWTAEERADDLNLQNLQARVRQPIAWKHAMEEGKLACVTSNLSEAFAGYWTFGGDGHMGGINLCGGIFKSDLREILAGMQRDGLGGRFEEKPVLEAITRQKATADLRKPDASGQATQADEDDLMPYPQLDAIARTIILQKNSPIEAYHLLKQAKDKEGQPLFASNEELLERIDKACTLWHYSQFKRVASVIAPFLGNNMDPHQAVRTTILSDGFQTGRALLKLEYLREKQQQAEGAQTVEELLRMSAEELRLRTQTNGPFRAALLSTQVADLGDAVFRPGFGAGAERAVLVHG